MAVRLVLMIADAVRRAAEKRAGKEQNPPPVDQSVPQAAGELKGILPPDVATALMSGADWPRMAQQLVALQRAGVDMSDFLPRVGEIAVTVRDAVAANAARIAREGTGEWAQLLRETMPAGPVREAILASPAWPEIAETMGKLQEHGVDVRQILVTAHAEGVGVDQAVARVMEAGKNPVPLSRDAVRSYGPLTVGLDTPKDLDLSNRERALAQLGVSQSENARFVRYVQEAMPGKDREAALLANSRQWPLLAARMARMEDEGKSVPEHLARLMRDQEWQKGGPVTHLGSRLVQATSEALRKPTREEAAAAPVVTTAAKASSVTTGPTSTRAKSAAPAEPAVAPHRQAPAPAPTAGRKR
jgi:hypothetical protein